MSSKSPSIPTTSETKFSKLFPIFVNFPCLHTIYLALGISSGASGCESHRPWPWPTLPVCVKETPSPCTRSMALQEYILRWCDASLYTTVVANVEVTRGTSINGKIGDCSASPPDSSLIWGSSGHSGWI